MNNKILTVVIPAYNVEEYLDETLPTFLSEKILKDIQIIIVNDGSKDKTEEIAIKYRNLYPKTIYVISKENGGHGSTINEGIKNAEGKYLKVVDGDDWVDTNEFIGFVQKLKNMNTDVVLSPYTKVYVDTQTLEKVEIPVLDEQSVYDFNDVICKIRDWYQMHSITIKTEILKKIPFIDEHCFYVDQEYVLYPVKYIESIAYLPFNIYRYRLGTEGQSMNWNNLQKNRDMHKKVVNSILGFYKDVKLNDEKNKFIIYRIAKLCERQLQIYLSMTCCNEIKEELEIFLNDIKNNSVKVYNKIPGKKAWGLRCFGIRCYPVLAMIMQRGSK